MYKIHYDHYDYIKNKHDNKSKLLFTDTERLMYEIRTEYGYEDFSSDKKMLDFSNYLTKSKYYYNSTKITHWKNKDETSGLQLKNFLD